MAFSLFGPVNWSAVLIVVPATVVGGYVGAVLARRCPEALIVAFGTTIGLVLLGRAFI